MREAVAVAATRVMQPEEHSVWGASLIVCLTWAAAALVCWVAYQSYSLHLQIAGIVDAEVTLSTALAFLVLAGWLWWNRRRMRG